MYRFQGKDSDSLNKNRITMEKVLWKIMLLALGKTA